MQYDLQLLAKCVRNATEVLDALFCTVQGLIGFQLADHKAGKVRFPSLAELHFRRDAEVGRNRIAREGQ